MDLKDMIALTIFFVVTVGYRIYYENLIKRKPEKFLKGRILIYKRTWVERILRNNEPLLAVQTMRNLTTVTSFLASATLIFFAALLNFLITEENLVFGKPVPPYKIFLILLIAIFTFYSFLMSLRLLNYFSVLCAVDSKKIKEVEKESAIDYLSDMLNKISLRYGRGIRGLYYIVAAIFWIYSTELFLLATILITIIIVVYLDNPTGKEVR